MGEDGLALRYLENQLDLTLRALGTGVGNFDGRRPAIGGKSVGWPSAASA